MFAFWVGCHARATWFGVEGLGECCSELTVSKLVPPFQLRTKPSCMRVITVEI